jgi:redox-sensing transcriptional repressor
MTARQDELDVAGRGADTQPHLGPRSGYLTTRSAPAAPHSALADASAVDHRPIPDATVARLAVYLRALTSLAEHGTSTVSSESLATEAGVNSAKLRKDLSYLGSYGVRGVGYDVLLLAGEIRTALGLDRNRSVALIGLGHLGQALVGYTGFASRGFRIAAVLDADARLVGTRVRGMTVHHIDELAERVEVEQISIAVIAVPASAAQQVCDQLVEAGVRSILNFAPTVLTVPDGVDVRKVDLAAELQILSFHDYHKAARHELPKAAMPL